MVLDTEQTNHDNHDESDIQDESQEQLEIVHKRLSQLSRGNGQLVTMSKQELSLLQKMLSTGTEEYRESQMWRMCSFLDQEEALDHIAAYYEAKDLGMDTTFNVSFAFALCSANRKGSFNNNLMALLTDTLQNGKWANNEKGKKNNGNSNPRSPLAGT
jgi:hypothetical protein